MRRDVMNSDAFVVSAFATLFAAVALAAFVVLAPLPAEAASPEAPCSCADQGAGATARGAATGPDVRKSLTPHDQSAVMQAVHYALSEVGDGASYVWHRTHGRLSGVVQITGSWRNAQGTLCRRVSVMLTSGAETRKLATHACRLPDRSWQLAPV